MRKYILLLALLVVALAMVACGSSEEPSGAEETSESSGIYASSFDELEMDANAKAALAGVPAYIDDYVVRSVEDGRAEGEEYLDVTDLEPVFIGYEVVAWEPIPGSEEVRWYEAVYMNDHVANGYASPETELASMPDPDTGIASNVREMPSNASAGEIAAVEAAKARLTELDEKAASWEYGVKRYLFLFEKDGAGLVVGMTADGGLGSNSMPILFAE